MRSTVGIHNNPSPTLTLIPPRTVSSARHWDTRAVFWAIISHQWCLWAVKALSGLTASTMCINLIMKTSKGNLEGDFWVYLQNYRQQLEYYRLEVLRATSGCTGHWCVFFFLRQCEVKFGFVKQNHFLWNHDKSVNKQMKSALMWCTPLACLESMAWTQ